MTADCKNHPNVSSGSTNVSPLAGIEFTAHNMKANLGLFTVSFPIPSLATESANLANPAKSLGTPDLTTASLMTYREVSE
jgi:hypothetical protein